MSNATGEHVTRTQTATEKLLCLYCKCKQDVSITGLEAIKFEYSVTLEIKRNDWLLADPCPQAANRCALF